MLIGFIFLALINEMIFPTSNTSFNSSPVLSASVIIRNRTRQSFISIMLLVWLQIPHIYAILIPHAGFIIKTINKDKTAFVKKEKNPNTDETGAVYNSLQCATNSPLKRSGGGRKHGSIFHIFVFSQNEGFHLYFFLQGDFFLLHVFTVNILRL